VHSRRITFSLFLPTLSLLLWVCLIAVPTTLNYARFLQEAHGARTLSLSSPPFQMNLPRARFLPFAAFSATHLSGDALPAINVPGFVTEMLVSMLLRSWPTVWHPAAIPFESWRAIIWPFYCLPFWWFAGIGFDALFRRRQRRWPWFVVGTLLCIVFIVRLDHFHSYCGLPNLSLNQA
jgi:hypothetical protein